MYFEGNGWKNTNDVVELAARTAKERGIRHIVAASVTGKTAMLLREKTDAEIICVTHVYGFKENGVNQMEDDTRDKLTEKGVKVLTTSHVLSGVERGISGASGGMYPAEIISNSLRMLGQGVKVGVEVAIMALDSGLIPFGKEVIAIGGSGAGADTAIILTPAHASKVFETRIHEIICKPR